MPPPKTIEVRVVPRNLRWEVSVNGVTRRLIDWLCTRDRAIEHAIERGQDLIRWDRNAQAVVIVESLDHAEEQRVLVAPRQDTSRRADERASFDEPSSSEAFAHHVARSRSA
jgi:hypothetical protein